MPGSVPAFKWIGCLEQQLAPAVKNREGVPACSPYHRKEDLVEIIPIGSKCIRDKDVEVGLDGNSPNDGIGAAPLVAHCESHRIGSFGSEHTGCVRAACVA